MKYSLIPALVFASVFAVSAVADSKENVKVKTRLDHLKGTPLVLVISQIPDEITSITCEKWTMMGQSSYKGHNQFSIPGAGRPLGVSIAVLDASGFDGYCKGVNDIQAHTDEGDYPCHLDAGPGNWSDSTKLVCDAKASD